MKIRNGFVSNSSSSSFTCDVCGNTESGMDASLSDFEMSRCIRDHTFCNCHQTKKPSVTEMRADLIEREKARTYRKPEEIQADVDKLTAMTDDDIEVEFSDNCDCYEVMSCVCPICTMEKITDYDALRYLLLKHGMTRDSLLAEVKEKFSGNYEEFDKFLRPPKV